MTLRMSVFLTVSAADPKIVMLQVFILCDPCKLQCVQLYFYFRPLSLSGLPSEMFFFYSNVEDALVQ